MVPEIMQGQIRDPHLNLATMSGNTLKIKQKMFYRERQGIYLSIYLSQP